MPWILLGHCLCMVTTRYVDVPCPNKGTIFNQDTFYCPGKHRWIMCKKLLLKSGCLIYKDDCTRQRCVKE